MKMNNKGFTLIELLAVIVLLAIIAGIGSYSITRIMKKSKDKNYELLIKNIKDAAEVYYQECRYANNAKSHYTYDGAYCEPYEVYPYDGYTIPLEWLVKQGYLTGNAKDEDGNDILVNPLTDVNIGSCYIGVGYNKTGDKKKLLVLANPTDQDYCPTNEDYGN